MELIIKCLVLVAISSLLWVLASSLYKKFNSTSAWIGAGIITILNLCWNLMDL